MFSSPLFLQKVNSECSKQIRVLQPGRVPGTPPDPDMGPGIDLPGRVPGTKKKFGSDPGIMIRPGPDPISGDI
jgi:hypothetical protein